MEFYSERLVKSARKEHQCHICGKTIKIGDSYWSEAGVFDGFFNRCTCKLCYNARAEYLSEAWDDEYTDYGVADNVIKVVCSGCEKIDECGQWGWADCDKVRAHYLEGD